jgi:triacylglycerol esterase/lipase EstA (alpha/beta hydrolase family)
MALSPPAAHLSAKFLEWAWKPGAALLILLLTSCTQIATVRHHDVALVASGRTDLSGIEAELAESQKVEHSEPLRALGGYLASADAATNLLKVHPHDSGAMHTYNFAVGRSLELIEREKLDPWHHPFTVTAPGKTYTVTGLIQPGPDRDPSTYEIIPTDTITEGGTYFQEKVTRDGLGMPVVAAGRAQSNDYLKDFATKRLYGTATGLIRFKGQRAIIEFALPLYQDNVELNGHSYPLAADFSAAIALGLTREKPQKLGFARMVRPEKYADTARLARLQLYDPNRIPVIFVHGLQDTPASWTPMINSLRGDPEIRKHYQFWVYSYPSGYPYPYSAALFRKEIDGIDKVFPDHKKIVLVGHSMGGIISRLMITDVGDKVWYDFFGKSPAETDLPGPTRKLLEESLIFNHRPEISRVIFICAPHRGSEFASNWIGRIGSSLVKMPFFMAGIPFKAVNAAMVQDPAAMQLKRIPNSIDTLSPNNRFVREIEKFPTRRGIPFHTIEGDRGRGNAPNSSDGVVPYWSSHMPGAVSELIVPSNHSATRNSEAIAEVKRILKLHLHSGKEKKRETASN